MTLIAAGFLLVSCGSESAGNTPQSAPSATTSPPASTSPANSSTTPPTSSENGEPDTLIGSVEFVGVSLDGNSIAVRPVASVQACAAEQTVTDVQVTESDDFVTVQVVMSRAEPSTGCIEMAVWFKPVTVLLQQPLGDRAVIDAAAPDTPLVPEIPAGHLEVTFRLEVPSGAIGGTAAPDGTTDFAYAGLVPSIRPIAESAVGNLARLARTNSDAFSLVIPPTGESIWFGLGRQSPPPGGPFERRTRDQLASVELPLPTAPGPGVIGQRILIRLEPGAFTTGEQPSIDPTKITLTWIEPAED